MAKVYLETSVISYLASAPSRDIIVAAHQQITRDWRDYRRKRFELVTSGEVVNEISDGDPVEAQRRLELVGGISLLAADESALELAKLLVATRTIPKKASTDALHIAIAAVNGIDFLLTWNCKHLANANIRRKIDETCVSAGAPSVVICTPDQLMEDE